MCPHPPSSDIQWETAKLNTHNDAHTHTHTHTHTVNSIDIILLKNISVCLKVNGDLSSKQCSTPSDSHTFLLGQIIKLSNFDLCMNFDLWRLTREEVALCVQ